MKRFIKTLAAIAATTIVFAACSNIMDDLKVRPASQPEPTPTPAPVDPNLSVPLTLEAAVAGAVVTFDNKAAGPVTYKVNGGEAQTIASGDSANITLAAVGDKVEFFGDNKAYATSDSNYSNIACDKDCYVYGNIMSLVQSEGFKDATELKENYAFCSLFRSNTHIKNKSGAPLLLPATSLTAYCYYYMFYGCKSLTAAPSLPAATLAYGCYECMFYGCTSLKAAPSLPANTLANHCYYYMFQGCTSLTAAPALPATILAVSCYYSMFSGCTSLKTAPSLPATTLAGSCYGYMFQGCASLASVTCLATNISASNCTTNWLDGVASTGTFKKADGMTGWTIDSASGIPTGWTVRDSSYSVPLTLEAAIAGAVVTFNNKADGPVTYKVNGGEAQTIASGATENITLTAASDKVEFFGDNKAYATNYSNYSNIACDKDCYVYGNIMSLITSEGFENATTLENAYTFARLFAYNTHIKNKDGAYLLLPAATLADNCYQSMFYGCASLTAAPSLPAATLAKYCYCGMFSGCASLTAAPSLPATTLADHCYIFMFQGCTSLTAAPSLPATTLAQSCYEYMFYDCTSLKAAPELKATTLAVECYECMFQGCTSLTAAPSLPATTLASYCYAYMFDGCASLTAAPELKAATLASFCYYYMFSGCSKLTAASSLPAATLAQACYAGMFLGCTSLNNVTCLATDISAESCTTDWLDGVAASGTFTKAAGMTSWPTGASGIPSGWNVLPPESVPLTLEAAEAGAVVTFDNKAAGPVTYKVNGGAVQTIASGVTENITLAAVGAKVEFFGDNKAYAGDRTSGDYSNIACSADCYVYGNIMSLVKKDGFKDATTLEQEYTFASLFRDNIHIKNKDGADLLLPATTLTGWCYYAMFKGCTGLTAAPALKSKSMKQSCYEAIFYGCTSLATAPDLPATTMASFCYQYMFFNCTGLTTTPALPATTLVQRCYYAMFRGCACLTTTSEISAIKLSDYSCGEMFSGCEKLSSVTCLATDISDSYCTTNWLSGVAASGTFTKASGMNDWTTGTSGIPSGWTVVDKQ